MALAVVSGVADGVWLVGSFDERSLVVVEVGENAGSLLACNKFWILFSPWTLLF